MQHDLREPLPFAWRDNCPRLTEDGAAEKISAMVMQAAVDIERRFQLPVVMIEVDTVGAPESMNR